MADLEKVLEKVSVISAKKGDLVEYETPEFDVVNDGNSIRVTEVTRASKVFSPDGILALRANYVRDLAYVDGILAEMVAKGIMDASRLPDQ
jgi:hypothetical protein